jgi:L-fucose isomerase-like protein
VWGPEVVTIPLAEVVEACRAVLAEDPAGLRREAAELVRRAAEVVEPDSDTLAGALALYRALRGLVDRHRLDAVTVRCFDLLGPVSNTGCLALSLLNDEGVTAACEGDLPALLTMMVLARLTGRPVFMANPSDLDEAAGTVTFAHCSVPLGLVGAFRLRSHFESGVGVGLEGRFEPGVVTVARIGGRDLRQAEVFRGQVQASGPGRREDLCRTQVTLAVGRAVVRRLLEAPLGNHHLIVPGDHAEAVLDCLERVPA